MTILNNGNVGINTSTPNTNLDIDGTLHVNSNTTMKDNIEIAPTINEQQTSFSFTQSNDYTGTKYTMG